MKNFTYKTLVFTLLCFGIASISNATIHTVDNKPNSTADFTALQEAINAAAAGDTIYIAGSPDSYGAITITKTLALIGAGYKVDNQWGLTTQIGGITLEQGLDEFNDPISTPTGNYFSGLKTGSISFYNGTDHLIERCESSYIYSRNDNTSYTIRNSIIYSNNVGSDISDVSIQNSIILGGVYSNNSSSNVIVDHCLFLNQSAVSNSKYVIVTNSIMYSVSTGGAEFSTFSNNMSIGGTETEFLYGSNTGGGNFPGTNPQFRVIDGATFSFTDDFRLQEGSPAIGAATDGTDIGIYGGNFPFPIGGEGEYLMAAPPKIPQLYQVDILNSALPENGTLEVNIKARKQN